MGGCKEPVQPGLAARFPGPDTALRVTRLVRKQKHQRGFLLAVAAKLGRFYGRFRDKTERTL